MRVSRRELVDWLRRDEWQLFVTLTTPRGLPPHGYQKALTAMLNHYGRLVGCDTPWQAVGNCEPFSTPNEDGSERLHLHALVRYEVGGLMGAFGNTTPRFPAVRKDRMRRLAAARRASDEELRGDLPTPDTALNSYAWLADQDRYSGDYLDIGWFSQWWGHIYYNSIFRIEVLRSTSKATNYIMKTLQYAMKNYDEGSDRLVFAPDPWDYRDR